MSDWERWLEFCARIDGFPRHLSIHSGGMLVTAAPLIDIAPIERATMDDRVVVQFDKRDVEELKLIKLDLLGLGMLAAIDETLQLIEHDCGTCVVLDAIPEQIPEVFEMLQAADTVGVFQIESRAQMQTLPKSRPTTLDDLVVEVAIIRPGPIQGNAVHPYLRRKQGLEPVTYLHPSLEPVLRDSMGVILYQEQVMRIAIEVAGFTPGGERRLPAGDGHVALEPRDGEAPPAVPRRLHAPAGHDRGDRRGAVPAGLGVRRASGSRRATPPRSRGRPTSPASSSCSTRRSSSSGSSMPSRWASTPSRCSSTTPSATASPCCRSTSTRSTYKTTTEWVGRPGWALAGAAGDDGSHDDRRSGRAAPRGLRDRRYARARSIVGVRDPGRGARGSGGPPRARPAGASGSGCSS